MEPTPFETIYRAYRQDVFRYSLWLCGDVEEAEEITSTAFFRAWTSAPLREGTAKSYLLAIARNLFLDGKRRGRRLVPLENAGAPRSPDADPETRTHVRKLYELLQGLEAKYRDPLMLWAAGGLSYGEIAAELAVPLAVVKTRIHRARLLLAGMMEKGES
ncbi:MAG: RNA polymerase sigma factor [Bryobacteraceae bacterium]